MNPNTLNYRPTHSAVYYTPPQRIYVGRTLVAFALSALAVIVVGYVYARIQPELHNLYLRLGETVAGAIVVGVVAMQPTAYGKVRLPVVAACMGAGLATIAVYAMWLTWVHGILRNAGGAVEYGELVTHPIRLYRVVRFINSFGTWSYHGDVFRGPALLILWVGEATAILLCGVLFPLKAIGSDDPTCLSCGAECKLVRPIARFAVDRRDELVAHVENRNFRAAATCPPPANEDDPQLSVRLMACPRCGQTNVVTMNNITWVPDRTAGRKLDIRPLVNQLMVTPAEAAELREAFKQMADQRAAATAAAKAVDADVNNDANDAAANADGVTSGGDDVTTLKAE